MLRLKVKDLLEQLQNVPPDYYIVINDVLDDSHHTVSQNGLFVNTDDHCVEISFYGNNAYDDDDE